MTQNDRYMPDEHGRQAHIREAINRAGGSVRLARTLAEETGRPMDQSTPAQWIRRGSVPVEWCMPLVRHSAGAFRPACVRRFWPMEQAFPEATRHEPR